ncbi:MAG: TldD/PmbA family protein [Cellulosilyticaceae bacterium]
MQVNQSKYLQQVKPIAKKLLEALMEKYAYASVLATDSKGKTYSVSRVGMNIVPSEMTSERGFVVKVYDGKGYGEYAFTQLTEEVIPSIVETIEKSLVPMKNQLADSVQLNEYGSIDEDATEFSKTSEFEKDPREMGDEAIISFLRKIHEEGLQCDEKVIDCRVGYDYVQINKLFLSPKKEMEQSLMNSVGMMSVIAADEGNNQYSYKTFSRLGGAELLEEMNGKVQGVARVAVELLKAETITPGEYDVICSPDVTGMIVHEAFGHGVEMDMFVKKRALAEAYVGKYVASPLVTMHDGALAAEDTGTYYFDDEGVLGTDTIVIEKGILKQGISDSHSAMNLGTVPTGNGRRENFERKAYTRMTNTYFEKGESTMEEMIATIEYGFLLEEAMSGMEDPKNWGIQCMVNSAREIKDGKLTGRIFSPIVLTGYVPDLLKSISMVGNDLELSGSGYCGKGYKEWVKVSSGGPSVKARVRLG